MLNRLQHSIYERLYESELGWPWTREPEEEWRHSQAFRYRDSIMTSLLKVQTKHASKRNMWSLPIVHGLVQYTTNLDDHQRYTSGLLCTGGIDTSLSISRNSSLHWSSGFRCSWYTMKRLCHPWTCRWRGRQRRSLWVDSPCEGCRRMNSSMKENQLWWREPWSEELKEECS